MNRTILFIGYDATIHEEIGSAIADRSDIMLFSGTTERSIRLLEENNIQTVVLNFQSMKDAALLKYINKYHPTVKVVIDTSEELDGIIDVFSKGKYKLMRHPFELSEIGKLIL